MLKRIIIKLIERYQRRGGGNRYNVECNFSPTCSEYGKQAIQVYGVFKGGKLLVNRLRRCNQRDLVEVISDPLPIMSSSSQEKKSCT